MKWTEAQRQTIEIRNKNILVSAAAGSGKTAVLIERIKQLILKDKVDIDRFLITTFTNAAAAEMKERLEKAIREELNVQGSDKTFLKKQLRLLPKAGISTFHTFALDLMRHHFYLTDLEPGFRIGDEIQVSIIKNEAVNELFENRFNEDYDRFKEFLKKYSSDRSERKLKDNVISLYSELRSIPYYMQWAEERTELLKGEFPAEAVGITDTIIKETSTQLNSALAFYEKAADILRKAEIDTVLPKAEADVKRVRRMAEFAAATAKAGEAAGNNPQDRKAEQIRSRRIPVLKKLISNPGLNSMRASKVQQAEYDKVKDKVGAYRKEGKKLIDDLAKKYFRNSFAQYSDELRASYDDTKYMVGLIREFETIFREKKHQKNIVDFDDVMHYAIDILQDAVAVAEYREKYLYIFVDEFQDSNMLQETIIKQISGGDNLFMVGDVKQSIYKFRLAEPEIFKRKYALYKNSKNVKSTKIDLNSNFRSKQKVTKTVNAVFERIMDDYDEEARLHCMVDKEHAGYRSSLHIICKGNDGAGASVASANSTSRTGLDSELIDGAGAEAAGELIDGARAEAALTAQLIRENVGQTIYDVKQGKERPIEYRDIAVLSRNKSMIGEIEQYLNNEGIPAYGENTGSYFESVEVQVFINLLRVIDNMRRDIPLISVMRSVIFDFHVKELAAIRIFSREGAFYEAVRAYAKEGPDEGLKVKVADMFEKIHYWKAIRKTISLEELVGMLLYETGYFDYCSGLPMGRQRTSNLQMLVQKAAEFEENNYSSLYGFLSYVEAMKQGKLSIGEAKTVGENENVVKVMTVHKSKGLEFPVVILAGAGRKIKFRGVGSSAVMHKDLAIGMPLVNREEHWHRKSMLQKTIADRKSREEFEEEIRILYVAMTRAMDRLIIIGRTDNPEKLAEGDIMEKSFLGMVYGPMSETGEEIKIHYDSGLVSQENTVIETGERFSKLFRAAADVRDEKAIKAIDERLSFVYPYSNAARVKSKYSVTDLNKKSMDREIEDSHVFMSSIKGEKSQDTSRDMGELTLREPVFEAGERILDAARIGTLMHIVMEKIDFVSASEGGRSYVRKVLDKLLREGFLSEEEKAVVNVDDIVAFFMNDVGKRAAAARNLRKEQEFIMEKEIDGVPAIVQGIIDCYFEEEDGLVLIDYKNSYLGTGINEEIIKSRYEGQIRLYEEALEAATGKKVKEAYLYLFNSGKMQRI